MNNQALNKSLVNYINDPKYPLYNFSLAFEYDCLGQNASALSFYLRTAELTNENIVAYEALLRIALCVERIGNRVYSLKGIVLRAISLIPDRPEAYFMMARICEQNKDWHEAYTFACIGESMTFNSAEKLKTDVGYPGYYGFTFERAVSAWWLGLYDESVHLLRKLEQMPDIAAIYMNSVKSNLSMVGYLWKRHLRYDKLMYHDLRMKFPGASAITENFSQCFQDMFILMMTQGRYKGSFLEIGCGDPWFNNNTALLAKELKWTGVSIDIDAEKVNKFKAERPGATVLCADATRFDYKSILTNEEYDYLQIDCDPAIVSYQVLKSIPFEDVRFAVITFEHDHFCDENKEVRDLSRKYLESFGYVMVVNNIAEDRFSDFEDWWIHPDLVDPKIVESMKCITDNPKRADYYIYGKI